MWGGAGRGAGGVEGFRGREREGEENKRLCVFKKTINKSITCSDLRRAFTHSTASFFFFFGRYKVCVLCVRVKTLIIYHRNTFSTCSHSPTPPRHSPVSNERSTRAAANRALVVAAVFELQYIFPVFAVCVCRLCVCVYGFGAPAAPKSVTLFFADCTPASKKLLL